MKNLYKIIILLLFSANLYSQQNLQNANWVFGDNSWLDFNNNLVTPQAFLPVIPSANREGVATLSDPQGNIVFWTNGQNISWLNGGVEDFYTNGIGLFGDISSSQNVVIIPRPNHPGIFYVVSITGYTTVDPGDRTGLYFSEVNTVTRTVLASARNIPLLDDGGIPIDNSYGNISESITVTLADDGTYWLVTHVQNGTNSAIYSYNVTEDGFGTNGDLLPNYTTSFPNPTTNPSLVLKVSWDRELIALSRSQTAPIIGSFSNGIVTFDSVPVAIGNAATRNIGCYGIEFAPNNSDYVYFTKAGTGVVAVDLINPGTEIIINSDDGMAIQKALNDHLYIARKGIGHVSEIGSPDNLFGDYAYNDIVNLAGRTSSVGLPQWIWLNNCEQTLILTSPDDDSTNLSSLFVRHIERSDWINASNVIRFGDSAFQNGVVYHAGNYVDLTEGFDAIMTSQFEAYPEGCTDNYVYKDSIRNGTQNGNPEELIKSFIVSPNPSKNFIDLTIKNDTFNKIIIAGIDGKIILDKTVEPTSLYNLDISRYASGVYIINVVSNDGKHYSQKLIKN